LVWLVAFPFETSSNRLQKMSKKKKEKILLKRNHQLNVFCYDPDQGEAETGCAINIH